MIPFTDFLRQIRRGQAVERATSVLADVTRAVSETGREGSLTLKITVKPSKAGGSEKLVTCKVESKIPTGAIPDAVFFSNDDGELMRVDPAQHEMELIESNDKVTRI